MKIVKLQQGRKTNWVEYIPVVSQFGNSGGGKPKASSTEKDKEDSFDKAIAKIVGEKGLQSDVDVFHNYAMNLLTASMYDDLVPGQSAAKLIQLSNYANKLSNSKKYFDEVVEHVRSNNTGDDYAMTGDGKVYVGKRDESGKLTIKTMDISKVKENLDEWTPLTNEYLLSVREYDHSFAFKNDMLRDIDGSVGMEQVSETVNSLISKYGSTESRQYLNLDESIKKGLDYLYKVTTTHSSAIDIVESNGKLQKDINAAVKYLYFNLNKNAKNTLKLNADLAGISVEEYLATAIIHNTSTKTIPDIEKSPVGNGSRGGSGSDGGEKLTNRSFINTVVLGEGVEDSTIVLSGHGNVGIKTTGQVYGFRDEEGNKIAMNNLEQILSQKNNALGNTVDLNSISIGNTLVNNLDLHKLVYDGSSTLNRMVLPIDEDVYAATGKIKPDLDALKKFQEFKKWSKDNPNASPQEQALKLEDLDLNVKYDPNTKGWKFNNTHVFLSINGYVSDEVVNIDDSDKQFLSHMSKSERKQLLDAYENFVNYGQASKDSDKKHPNAVNLVSFFDWVGQDNLYQGMIFMPVLSRGMEYIASSNEMVPKSTYVDMKNQRSLQDQQRNFRNNF